MGILNLTDREAKLFTEEYQEDVLRELRGGKEFAYSYNEVQFKYIPKMAQKVAAKKKGEFKVVSVNFGYGDDEKSSIVGWKIVKQP